MFIELMPLIERSSRAVREIALVRRNPEIKSVATPSIRPNVHYWVLHYEETVSCGVAVCLTNYSVNAAYADNSSA